ncbi:hypothetical protein JAAARDRAFT_63507 [Jaapia argillacea MUCL 33604]|uniref:Uncharacterized protein n=1 Tax=Jaapia argillacea MUCL 33604 TaxID=933084 RepID=A0A067P4L9_9AGAM|nr:hypothetical protein JAAARDRAFT_63507 [Jaapia argillacea MUCL 33604]
MVRFGCKPRLLPILLLGPPGYYIYTESQRLTSTYPALPPHLTTTRTFHFLAVPSEKKSQYVHAGYADVFIARVPRSALPISSRSAKGGEKGGDGDGESLNEKWAKVFLVEDPPSTVQPLTMSWHNPPSLIRFFEKIASWGYPFRLMSGGRHTLEVMMDDRSGGGGEGEGEWVLSFGCAHDYERVNPVDGKEDGKVVPEWVGWTHKTWARWLLDGAVKELMRRSELVSDRPLGPKVGNDEGGRKLEEKKG